MSDMNKSVQTINKNDETTQQQLLALLGKEKKSGKGRIIVAVVIAVALAGAGTFGFYTLNKPEEQTVTYRQYTVERGNVTVGTTESSSISLDREVVTFPVSTTVEEVYVKEGQSVKKGDPLMKLNLAEIEAGLVTYELQVKMAQLELEQAKLDQKTKLLKAEQSYNSAVLEGQLAAQNQSLTISRLSRKLRCCRSSSLSFRSYSRGMPYFFARYSMASG